ncbi:MAG: response regulator [Ardenticatenia bacterium]|nr:response regulator [Ardenticatenia bacterium]
MTEGRLLARCAGLCQPVAAEQETAEVERLETDETLRRRNRKLELRNRELALLNRIIAGPAAELAPEEILENGCRELAQAFDTAWAAAALLDVEETAATVVAEYLADDRPPALGKTIPLAGNRPLQHLSPLAVSDAQNDPRLAPIHELMRQRGTVSLLVVPLVINGEIVGGLGLDSIESREFSPQEVSLARSVSDQIGRVLAWARLAQTQRQLSTVIEQVAESVIITDTEGSMICVNPAFERMSGYSRSEVAGQNPHILKSGEHDTAFYQELCTTISAGKVWRGRLVNRRKDRSRYTVDTTITPVRGENGRIVNYVSLQREVTHESYLEEQYRQLQKMEAIGQLTAGIAHDFNNLLTVINGFAELLQSRLLASDPGYEMVDKILGAGQRGTELVRQLMTFSRKQPIKSQIVHLNQVVADTEKMLERTIGEHINLTTCLAPDLWPVEVDQAQIEQVIVNLAVNARDAMPHGGKLIVETANVVLDEDYVTGHLQAQPGEHVLLAVSDTGVGMTQEVKAHLFEPFFTTKEHGKGTGLGLATVYGIVKQSRGSIWVYSEEGLGTTFKIYLPRARKAAQPLSSLKTDESMPSGDETILLVEDDGAVRDLGRLLLQEQGYTVLVAGDGQEALRLAEDHSGPINLLLTDLVLPGMDGVALTEQMSQVRPELRSLLMSGYTEKASGHPGTPESGGAFLQKPFSAMELSRRVRTVLDR